MKKYISNKFVMTLTLVSVLGLGLAGCGSSEEGTSVPETTTSQATTTPDTTTPATTAPDTTTPGTTAPDNTTPTISTEVPEPGEGAWSTNKYAALVPAPKATAIKSITPVSDEKFEGVIITISHDIMTEHDSVEYVHALIEAGFTQKSDTSGEWTRDYRYYAEKVDIEGIYVELLSDKITVGKNK